MSQDSGPLEGIRVLDCTQMLAGPYCAMRLGDLGADVLKIEPPHGEWVRSRGFGDYRAGDDTIAFHALNRNKRSINIDLKSEVGREVFYELVRNADVFLQNFRVGVAKVGVLLYFGVWRYGALRKTSQPRPYRASDERFHVVIWCP